MAEAFVNVTEGSGKKLHTFNRTIGANSVEDEVVLLGENYLASYVANGAMSTATANSHLMQIMAGASLKVRIRRIEITQQTLATTAAFGVISIYRLTTAGTGGTALTPALLDPGDGASGATQMQLPTVKGTEGANVYTAAAYFMQTAGASSIMPVPMFVADFDRPRSKPLIIAAGTTNGVAIKMETAIAAAVVRVDIWFDESNF